MGKTFELIVFLLCLFLDNRELSIHKVLLVHSTFIYGLPMAAFILQWQKLSSCHRDSMASKAEDIYYLAFMGIDCPSLV